MCEEVYWQQLRVKRKAPHHGTILTNEVVHVPTLVVGGILAHVEGMVQMCYLSWSAGTSCKTWSQIVGVGIFPSSC